MSKSFLEYSELLEDILPNKLIVASAEPSLFDALHT